MHSQVIKAEPLRQVELEFDESLATRFTSLREVVAQGVYQRGLKAVAADLDEGPGNLSVMLSDNPARKFGVDDLETYLGTTRDMTPILYLVAKYLGDQGAARDHAIDRVVALLGELPAMLKAAGIQSPKGPR
jgi:hypothetical protein